ncbi:MAG: hypothetical protein ABI480_00940 [Chitinophagaceae bacterium]
MKSLILSLVTAIIYLPSVAQISGSPDNPKNPYDYVGANHNAGLDFIQQKYPNMSGQFFNENWKAIVSDFLTVKQLDSRNFLNIVANPKVEQKCGAFSFYTNTVPQEELKRFLRDGLISPIRYTKAIEVYDLVDQIEEMLTASNGDASKAFANYRDKMLKLEMGYRTLSSDDQAFCFMISSVAMHSAFYWFNEGTKNHSSWGVPKCSSAGMWFSFWRRLLGSDVGGAVAGVVKTGVVAVLGGPAGWTACGTAALGGAVGSSAGYAISSLFGL